MTDLDPFERRFADALLGYADEVDAGVDAAALAGRVLGGRRGRRARAFAWPAPAISRLAWVLIAAALLTALLVGSLVVGARRPDRAVVVAPTPMPFPTVIAAESDILATTKAKPLPAQATCPAGSNPDALGPAGQQRPLVVIEGASMAFDSHAGRIVLFAETNADAWRTWTLDVCANTWQRMRPSDPPPAPTEEAPVQLVYDADSDRTLAFADTGRIWGYDLADDRWSKIGWFPDARGIWRSPPGGFQWRGGIAAVYHDPSGLVIVYDGVTMWAYDVEANALAKVRQRPDPSRPAGSGSPDGTVEFSKISLAYDSRNDLLVAHVVPKENAQPETWTFDPGTGTWRLELAGATPEMALVGGYVWPEVGTRGVFDKASGLTLFNERRDNQLHEYDAAQRTWRTLPTFRDRGTDSWCSSVPPVFDSLNGRIVCYVRGYFEPSAVSAFTATTGEWRWLLEPPQPASPSP